MPLPPTYKTKYFITENWTLTKEAERWQAYEIQKHRVALYIQNNFFPSQFDHLSPVNQIHAMILGNTPPTYKPKYFITEDRHLKKKQKDGKLMKYRSTELHSTYRKTHFLHNLIISPLLSKYMPWYSGALPPTYKTKYFISEDRTLIQEAERMQAYEIQKQGFCNPWNQG